MTFLALLTKELRLRMRRERTIWVIIVYVLLMGLLGWFLIGRFTSYNSYGSNDLTNTGIELYILLSMVQLFLIVFITPAFTSTAVNGEKERQTYDLLLCSRLSAFSLVSGKLVAGLMNALLLIAASAPLFSLVFFFGGISPGQVLSALVVFVATALVMGAFGLLCSTIFKRPAVSTAITYMTGVLWMLIPLLSLTLSLIWTASSGRSPTSSPLSLAFACNPVIALYSTYPSAYGGALGSFVLGHLKLQPWVAYTLLDVTATIVFFLLSMWAVKPNPLARLRVRLSKDNPKESKAESAGKATAAV
jgi:ABC-type transport system involved in multi-copper enzyme maturation permease subunit